MVDDRAVDDRAVDGLAGEDLEIEVQNPSMQPR